MRGLHIEIEKETNTNGFFRKVIYTSKHLQVVLMALPPGGEIGSEVHRGIDQFFRVESGTGKCKIDTHTYDIKDGDAIVVPASSKHNIINTSTSKHLKLYSIYSPPNHLDQTIHQTKQVADESKEHFNGKTTE